MPNHKGGAPQPDNQNKRDPADQVYWFRHSAPYIHAYRGRTVVLLLPGEVLAHERMATIIQDLSLLNGLGLKLVVVCGARPQIDARLKKSGLEPRRHHDMRITDAETLTQVIETAGLLRTQLEARLSLGLANSPMHNAANKVSSGNFVTARPVGIVEGVDLGYTGYVRKINADAIQALLELHHIVLVTNLGYSPTGEIFNLACEDVASSVAIALGADKIIYFSPEKGILNAKGELMRQISLREAQGQLEFLTEDGDRRRRLLSLCRALQNGVGRAHLIDYRTDGALLQELFTRDGVGTLISDDSYDQIRAATIDDVGGILKLIQPLEEQGVLVRRSREILEREIHNFIVDDRDGTIVGCAALYPFADENCAELACVAVTPSYKQQGRGNHLLRFAEQKALAQGLSRLFVLTTQTSHWFIERGFTEVDTEWLPVAKRRLYNIQRNSKVLLKSLSPL